MRIASVMAGLACALAMCLAVPIASAAPTDHLLFDSGPGLELVVAPASVELVAVADVFEFAVPMLAAGVVAAADTTTSCRNMPISPDDGPGAAPVVPAMLSTSRRHDPGWRAG